MARKLARIATVGLLCALLVAAGGSLLRRAMLGVDDRTAQERITREVRDAFAVMSADLQRLAQGAGSPPDVKRAADGDDTAAGRLFAAAADAISAREDLDAALTTYAPDGRALAWAGRPTEIGDRLQGPEGWLLMPAGEFDLRLLYISPIDDGDLRVGAAVAERPLHLLTGGVRGADCGSPDSYCFNTRLGPVAIELPHGVDRVREEEGSDRFEIRSPSGALLCVAIRRPSERILANDRWEKAIRSVLLVVIAVTVLCLIGPLLDERNRAQRPAPFVALTFGAAGLVIASRLILSFASFADWTDARIFSSATYASYLFDRESASRAIALINRQVISPFDFLMTALAVAALASLWIPAVEQWRLRSRRGRLTADSPGRYLRYIVVQVLAGSLLALVLVAYRALLSNTIENTTLDLVHFSLQPWDPSRTALEIGLLIAGVAVATLGVLTLRAAMVRWRPHWAGWRLRVLTVACWVTPLVVWQASRPDRIDHQLPLLVAAGVVIATTSVATHLKARYRHGSQAFRLTLLALALVVPPFAFYPTLFQEAGHAKAEQVETRYADQVLNQLQTVQTQLEQSLDEIDALKLDELDLPDTPARARSRLPRDASTDRAFRIWGQTSLSLYPITSSIELYDADGNLESRFAFNLPERLTATPRSEEQECRWVRYGEVAAFFAEERPVLHAGRNLCSRGRPDAHHGSIVVHAMLDYENLPFISSRLPYRRLYRPGETASGQPSTGRASDGALYGRNEDDVEFAFYGWSFTPLYPSNQPAWELEGDVRAQLERDPSHSPFWRKLQKGGDQYDVYLLSDRTGIYALGFPVVTMLGHLVNLAELTVLAAICYFVLIAASGALTALLRRTVHAPALLREIRASFYRKLFLAFVAAVIFPVAALALVTRNYVAREMRATVEQEAVRTASSARRVVEDLVTQLSVGLDDNLMVWVSRLIDQDVNVFERDRLVATSERNLFAEGALPTRAPADIFWALQLRNEAAAVTHDRIGNLEDYLVAATPLTSPQQPGTMLTVPLTSGQREIEMRITTLNRHMLLGALLFILVGAGLGYSMAERISDPVNRLTRATRRISRGDLNARIVARSSDELRRLVDDFNSMAAELQRQQKALQQTHRLEAWAEMARQVAHDIKNPLTPIQLTAEHLRRVHADRGEPLSPVLQECVATILTQVRLLRQIASEFSNFASSPIARPAVVDVPELIRDILQPYRIGLQERIHFAVDVPSTLPPIFADRALMTRALTNIVENALHAMPAHGTLTLIAEPGANAVRLRVSDSGSGMDAEALARAFEPYFSTKASGTGLGLPIARRNIELNGGTIAISSERDRGTTVTLELPVHTART